LTAVARRLLAVLIFAVVVVPAAHAGTGTTPPLGTGSAQLSKPTVLSIFESYPKVHAWLTRYPATGRVDEETFDTKTRSWTVKIWWGAAGEIAQGRVDDASGGVLEAWTGPQVAWGMARGVKGAFGGEKINSPWIWGAFCAVFLVGLGNLRRPFSLRNLDLVMLLSPTASLWFFNHGDIFTAVPLFYPALLWVVVRGAWVGFTGRGSGSRPAWPTWVLLAATVFLAGFRVGLNVEASNVIDVGYSGVIGAQRIVSAGEAPWGHFPVEDNRPACGPADSSGEIRDRIQTNGRCESANPLGDTYGPTAYEAYIPGYLIRGWSGKWDSLPAVHFTSIAFDILSILGLWLVGLRFGGARLAATLAFAWAAFPFTQYASSSNTNDTIMPCLLIYGFWLASSPVGRGVFGALSAWSKFATLIVAPLWATYPDRRPSVRFILAFAVATLAAFSVVFLDPHPLHELRVFWDRTVAWQKGRSSPFSLWDWRQYHARGLPDLHIVQKVLEGVLVVAAFVVAFVPRRKSPLQLAALTAALLAGFELVLTYWLYTYIPWYFPFAAVAVLAPAATARVRVPSEELDLRARPLIPSAG
jgi:hypothetical protein